MIDTCKPALLWADRPRSWPRLYRVLEEIEAHLGKNADHAGLCSDGERSRFRRSTQVPEVAGKDARHRVGLFQPPANPLTLQEAEAFIGRLLTAVLKK